MLYNQLSLANNYCIHWTKISKDSLSSQHNFTHTRVITDAKFLTVTKLVTICMQAYCMYCCQSLYFNFEMHVLVVHIVVAMDGNFSYLVITAP